MIRFHLFSLFIFVAFCACPEVHGQRLHDSVANRVKSVVDAFQSKYHSPGIVVAIVHKDDIVFSHAAGFMDVARKIPATADSKFPIMSVTKTFTATMLMQLVEKGTVRLEDPVDRYVPEYKVQSDFPGYGTTCLFQLATHTAGLPRNTPADSRFSLAFDRWMLGDRKDSVLAFSRDKELLASLEYMRLAYPPFELVHHNDRHYSNVGYSILGIALQRAARIDFADYVSRNICRPLQMKRTGFLNERHAIEEIARGYRFDTSTGTLEPLPVIQINSALYAGGMYSTAPDLCKFISSQFEDGSSLMQKVISPRSRAMMRSQKLGWKPAYPYVLHEGALPGYRSIVVFNPYTNVGWVVLANIQEAEFNSINGSLADIVSELFRERYDTDLQAYVGTYDLRNGYGSLNVSLKDGRLYSTYLRELLPGRPLVAEGTDKFKVEAKGGHAIQYEFGRAGDGTINGLKMGQFVWHKKRTGNDSVRQK